MTMPDSHGNIYCKKCGGFIAKTPKGIICVFEMDYCNRCKSGFGRLSDHKIPDNKKMRELIKRQVIRGDILNVKVFSWYMQPVTYDITIRGENGI